MKELQPERCGIALYVEGQENQWYIDSGCPKHMTGDKEKLQSYSTLEKAKKISVQALRTKEKYIYAGSS